MCLSNCFAVLVLISISAMSSMQTHSQLLKSCTIPHGLQELFPFDGLPGADVCSGIMV